jgi:CPA2 family monovalent cation:H+ antiporter-2
LIVDAVVLTMLIVGAALEMDRFIAVLGSLLAWPEWLVRVVVIAGALVAATPLVVGLVRLSWRLALVLAVRALPATDVGKVDFARAPRTALVATLQMAILLAILAPITAIAQPFFRGTPTIAVLFVAAAILAIAFWRAARDLHGHARAGAEVIAGILSQQMDGAPSSEKLSRTMERASAALPGLGAPTAVILDPRSVAVGKTLSEVNLRGVTGATVLAIFRTAGETPRALVPTGREMLYAGDVLTVAGTHDAVAAARNILENHYELE